MKLIEIDTNNNDLFSLEKYGLNFKEDNLSIILYSEPNVINSNCAILIKNKNIIIIDPGGSKKQVNLINHIVKNYSKNNQSVYILLTHCHPDHSYNIYSLKKNTDIKYKVILNKKNAEIFSGGQDRDLLLEDIVDKKLPILNADYIFPDNIKNKNILSDTITITKKNISLKDIGIEIFNISISDFTIDFFYTPGHTPDSMTYIYEDLIITGDILFSINSGVAGLLGWSYEDLIVSINKLFDYISNNNNIKYVISGHGKILNIEIGLKIISKIKNSVHKFENIQTIDSKRKKQLINNAIILLKKSEEMFAVIGGRLHRIEYYLNETEEKEAANMIKSLIDFNIIDNYISDFYEFIQTHVENNLPQCTIYLKGVEFVYTFKKIFNAVLIKDIIDFHYIRLCEHLINSYLRIVTGLNYNSPPPCNLKILIEDLLRYIKNQKLKYVSIPENIDSVSDFTNTLIQRFSYKPLEIFTPEINIIYNTNKPFIVYIYKELIEDIFYSIFEYYAINKIDSITIVFDNNDEEKLLITIIPSNNYYFSQDKIDFYNMLLEDTNIKLIQNKDNVTLLINT